MDRRLRLAVRGALAVLVLVVALVAALLGVFASPAASAATSGPDKWVQIDVAGDGAAMGEPADGPILSGGGLAPGQRLSGSVTVASKWDGTLTIAAVGVRSDDHGCSEPESAAGDTSCGSGDGELARFVDVTVRSAGTADAVWAGSLDELATGRGPSVAVAGGVPQELVLEAGVSGAAGNVVQSDDVAFDLVFAVERSAGSGRGRNELTLAAVGVPAEAPVGVPLAAMVLGCALMVISAPPLLRPAARRLRRQLTSR